MKKQLCFIALTLVVISNSVMGHGKSGASGEWLAVVEQGDSPDVVVQIQSSPLGSEILLEYKGKGWLEILAPDGQAFLRISEQGVEGNVDHPAWYRTQVAGERPLPERVKDGVIKPLWKLVSAKPYWGWYDKRLSKQTDHQDSWKIDMRANNAMSSIKGYFKSLSPPLYRTMVTLDRKRLGSIDGLSAILIQDVQSAIRLSYRGNEPLIVLDEYQKPMLKFSQSGVHVRVASQGWQELGRLPLQSDAEWVMISSQAAYTWPDSRLGYNEEVKNWSIPLKSADNDVTQAIVGSWLKIKSVEENYAAAGL